jgi:hypothetical protein
VAAAVMLWLAASAVLPWIRFDRPSPAASQPRATVRAEPTEEAEDFCQVVVCLEGNASFCLDGGS